MTTVRSGNFRKDLAHSPDAAEHIGLSGFLDFILGGVVAVIGIEDIDETYRFFAVQNDTGVPLTSADILKSYHLMALSDGKANDPELERKIVDRWESYYPEVLNDCMDAILFVRDISYSRYPRSIGDMGSVSEFKEGKESGSSGAMDALAPVRDGAWFFEFIDRMYRLWAGQEFSNPYDLGKLDDSMFIPQIYLNGARFTYANYFYKAVVMMFASKYPEAEYRGREERERLYREAADVIFARVCGLIVRKDTIQWSAVINYAGQDGSLIRTIAESSSITDVIDSLIDDPMELPEGEAGRRWKSPGYYLMRRELRRIYRKGAADG